MADKKISQLTGATTPLAGTEVLPIVQSGTTVKVSVDNLTAGRPISATDISATKTLVVGESTGIIDTQIIKLWRGSGGGGQFGTIVTNGNGLSLSGSSGYVSLQNNVFVTSTDITNTSGNYIQGTAAKGVNFTANTPAAGMTSQLLNWYEEGTWTPGQGGGVTVVGSYSSSGTYTRVGRQVTVHFVVSGSTSIAIGSGSNFITGLPFASSSGVYFVGSSVNSSATQSTNPFLLNNVIYSAEAISAVASIHGTITYTI